jgi:hypothetical protein
MKKNLLVGIQVALLLMLAMGTKSWGQQDYMPPMSGWPGDIQTAWQVQGEYYGADSQDPTKRLGAWVVANGGSKFGLVVLPGGLLTIPGQLYGGWDQKTRHQGQVNGKPGPIVVTLSGKTFKATTATGGFTSDSITGTGEERTLYLHNGSANYSLIRVKRNSPTRGFRYTQVKDIPGGSSVVSLWDSASGQADISKWQNWGNNPQVKYKYLFCGVKSVQSFGAAFIHVEFLSPFNPTATDQGRANSGVYMQGHHETQVLDSFGLSGAQNEFGGIYETKAPVVNASLPPQVTLMTYDIYFTPRTSGVWSSDTNDAGAAVMTVYANGVLVQDATRCPNITTGASSTPSALQPGPLCLQNHTNEVAFNNVWVVPGATTKTLPYSSILSAATPTGLINYQKSIMLMPLSRKSNLQILGLAGGIDASGRHIHLKNKGESIVFPKATVFK